MDDVVRSSAKLSIIDRRLWRIDCGNRELVAERYRTVSGRFRTVWLVPEENQPDWIRDARSKPILKQTGDAIIALLPEDPEKAILERLRNREGSIVARGEYLWKGGAFSYTYVPQIAQSDAANPKLRTEIDRLTQFNRDDAHWAKIYQLVAGYDLSLHYFYRQRHNIGLAVAKVLGDALELHAEGRATRGSSVLTPYKRSEDIYVGPTLVQPALYDFQARSDETWYARVLVGGQYTFENKLNLSVEYYYNGEGYSRPQFSTYTDALQLAGSRYRTDAFILPVGNPYRLFILAANLQFNFLSMGQHYVFMRLADPEFFGSTKWEAAVYALSNAGDGSGLAACDITYRINDRFDLQFLVNGFFGHRRSEAGLFYQGMSALLALEAQF